MISRADARSSISPVAILCMIAFPIAVASTGPETTFFPVSFAVRRDKSSF